MGSALYLGGTWGELSKERAVYSVLVFGRLLHEGSPGRGPGRGFRSFTKYVRCITTVGICRRTGRPSLSSSGWSPCTGRATSSDSRPSPWSGSGATPCRPDARRHPEAALPAGGDAWRLPRKETNLSEHLSLRGECPRDSCDSWTSKVTRCLSHRCLLASRSDQIANEIRHGPTPINHALQSLLERRRRRASLSARSSCPAR